MIEINLLPGAKRAKRGGGPKFNFGAAFSGLSARVKDRWLATAVICGLLLPGRAGSSPPTLNAPESAKRKT